MFPYALLGEYILSEHSFGMPSDAKHNCGRKEGCGSDCQVILLTVSKLKVMLHYKWSDVWLLAQKPLARCMGLCITSLGYEVISKDFIFKKKIYFCIILLIIIAHLMK